MRRHRSGALGALFTVLLMIAGTGAASGAGGATHVKFVHWHAYTGTVNHQVSHTVAPGGTFSHCASKPLVHLRAYYSATGPSSGPDGEYWYLNGHLRDTFHDSRMGTPGWFGLVAGQRDHGRLPDGNWSLKITYAGKTVGRTSIKTVATHC